MNRLDELFEKHTPPLEQRERDWEYDALRKAVTELRTEPGAHALIMLRSKFIHLLPGHVQNSVVIDMLRYLTREEEER